MILAGVISSAAFAQKGEVNDAKKKWEFYYALGRTGLISKRIDQLKIIIAHTDKAIANEDSKIMPAAWGYRALAASEIAISDTSNLENINANLKIAKDALKEIKPIDPKNTQKDNVKLVKANIEVAVRNAGIIAYQKKDYKSAFEKFAESTTINPKDTSMYMNAGVAAYASGDYPNSIKYYKKAINLNIPQAKDLYRDAINMYLINVKDTTSALEMAKEAQVKYPDDINFITTEADIYLKRGDVQQSEKILFKLAEKDPKNSVYQGLLGNIYLQQAIDLQSKIKKFDPKTKVDIKAKKENDDIAAQRDKLVDKSMPFFLKAVELDGKNASALENLKVIYFFKNDTKNWELIKARIEALPKK